MVRAAGGHLIGHADQVGGRGVDQIASRRVKPPAAKAKIVPGAKLARKVYEKELGDLDIELVGSRNGSSTAA